MNNYYYIGNSSLLGLIQEQNIGKIEKYSFHKTVFPSVDKSIKAIIIQAETPNRDNVFDNIYESLPIMLKAVDKPIILMGILSKKFYKRNYHITFYPDSDDSNIQYFQLFNDKFESLIELPKKNTTPNLLLKEYYKKVDIAGKLNHDLKKFKIMYAHTDFNKYTNLLKIFQL
jgi:hypothetical protein